MQQLSHTENIPCQNATALSKTEEANLCSFFGWPEAKRQLVIQGRTQT